jgi:hypothetical protein
MIYEISDRKAENEIVFAELDTRRYLDASIVIPSVRATVSLPATLASYTRNSSAPGVPAAVSKPTRTVIADEDWLQITRDEMTASVAEGVVYNVAYVPVEEVP